MNIIETYIVDYNRYSNIFPTHTWTKLYETLREGYYLEHPHTGAIVARLSQEKVDELTLLIPF